MKNAAESRFIRDFLSIPPPAMIVVTFAVPQESKSFLHGLRHTGSFGPTDSCWQLGNVGLEEVLIVHSGVGLAAAESTAAEVFANIKPRAVISCGFAGALNPDYEVGDLIVADNISDLHLIESARPYLNAHTHFGAIHTSPSPLENVSDKKALRETSGAAAVDMETSAWAKVCRLNKVPLLAVRVISDAADQPLPVPLVQSYDLKLQRPRPLALLGYLAGHPWRIIPFIRFVHALTPASETLGQFLHRFLAHGAVQDARTL